jgi:hypothetical protein
MRKNYFTVFLTSVFVGAVILACEALIVFVFRDEIFDLPSQTLALAHQAVVGACLIIAGCGAGWLFASGLSDIRARKLLTSLSEQHSFDYRESDKPEVVSHSAILNPKLSLLFTKTDAAFRNVITTDGGLRFGSSVLSPFPLEDGFSNELPPVRSWFRGQYVLYGPPTAVKEALLNLKQTGGYIATREKRAVEFLLADGTPVSLVVLWMTRNEVRNFVSVLK